MTVKIQRPIVIEKTCHVWIDRPDVAAAIAWYAKKPVCRIKKVFMHGRYAAVSIHEEKIHVHRLLMMWKLRRKLGRAEYVHHKDENRLNNHLSNLELMAESDHQSHHNKGKFVSAETRSKLTETNKKNWATKWKHRRLNPELLK